MVGNDTHSDVGRFSLAVFYARHLGDGLDDGLEYISVVVRGLALQHADKALKAHARVDVLGREFHQLAVGHSVVLHEHEVPDFNHLRVVHVNEVAASYLLSGFVVTKVDVDFGARTAGTRFAHFPEVVLLVPIDDAVFADMFFPVAISLHVSRLSVLFITTKNSHVKSVLVDLHHLSKVFPSIGDGFLFEIIAKRPVAQHFEHGVMVGVVADFLQVVVLARHT